MVISCFQKMIENNSQDAILREEKADFYRYIGLYEKAKEALYEAKSIYSD